MSGIKSTVEMIYDARSNASGMIEIEVLGWTYEPINTRYVMKVADYVITMQEIPIYSPTGGTITQSFPMKNMIIQKDVVYTREQIDAIFVQLGNPIELSESFTDEMDVLVSGALLLVTQQDPIYRVASTGLISTAADWILK